MKPPPSLKAARDEADPAVRAIEDFEARWRRGEIPSIAQCLADCGPDPSVSALVDLIKADLRRRFGRGERPTIAEYLDRFPVLAAHAERMLSLTYEEYCLLEERGERPDPDSFCARYEPWRSSLYSQLRYHAMLSRVVSPSGSIRFPEEGEYFGPCYLERVIGRGGAARVYLARDEDLGGAERALKVSADRGDEPKIQGRLDHPHIVQVLNVIRQPESGLRGMSMPYRPGLSLDRTLETLFPKDAAGRPARADALRQAITPKDGPFPVEPPGWRGFPDAGRYDEGVAWVIATVARALEYAHARQILHRDVKPANILLTVTDGPQLLDFNLAHAPNASEEAEAALRGGTLPYMAPEQLLAFLDPERWDDVGPAADLYGLGLVLSELLTGRRPEAPGPDLPLPRAIAEMLDRRTERPKPLRAADPTIPAELDRVVLRCLEPDPDRRYNHAGEMAAELEAFVRRRASRDRWTRARLGALPAGIAIAALLLALIPDGSDVNVSLPAASASDVDHEALGDRQFTAEKYAEAVEHYEQALDRLRKARAGLAPVPLAKVLHKLGRSLLMAGRYAQADPRYAEASRLLDEVNSPDDRKERAQVEFEHADNLFRWARVAYTGEQGQSAEALAEAASHYEAALQHLEWAGRLAERPDSFLINRMSGIIEVNLGIIAINRGQFTQADKSLREGLADLRIAKAERPDDVEVESCLKSGKSALDSLSDLSRERGQGDPAPGTR